MFDRILLSTCLYTNPAMLFKFLLLFRIHPSFCHRYSSFVVFVIYLTLKIIVNDLL
ncbi:hypothetical protein BDC45DRAFT_528981 [Circinella umbellata]|nr:hypothetical protein BDC45DRAFT_528981 [Circinella umbellata]